MPPILTIVGSSARAAAQAAASSGFVVHAGDLFADTDLVRIAHSHRADPYPDDLERVIRGPQPGGWMYTGALENRPDLIDAWSRIRPLLGNPAEIVRQVRDPVALANALRRHDLPAVEARFSCQDLSTDGSWLVKPLSSAGGMHIEEWRGSHQHSPGAGCYFQRRVVGVPSSAVFVAAGGRAVMLGAGEQLIGLSWANCHGYRYCGSIGPLDLAPHHQQQFRQIGDLLAGEFQLTGLFGVDAIINPDGVWPVEVNPRYTASVEILERACGLQAVAWHVGACLRGELPTPAPARACWGKCIVFAKAPGRLPAQLPPALRPVSANEPRLADLPASPTTIERGAPIATVLASGPNRAAVLTRLERLAIRLMRAVEP